ncbi:LOW QUALITY PROTEIN: hypothetical protein PoB_007697200 [Plakobranchus ocellatus]|uniref:Uncharacterized protein n=1 Tax=Plakobranchus ocellatus TaxID=259542 RepID=A0AAV4E2F9_9GAST|nr:LOW QUALITY PROTEIN: hypothetical protein PoB_007697200 [Plakobranchus ocellatus]
MNCCSRVHEPKQSSGNTHGHPRAAIPTAPPPHPKCRDKRACQDKVATAIRTFKDTAHPTQPFPKRHPSEVRIGRLCLIHPLPPSGLPGYPCQVEMRKEAPPSGQRKKGKRCHRRARKKGKEGVAAGSMKASQSCVHATPGNKLRLPDENLLSSVKVVWTGIKTGII